MTTPSNDLLLLQVRLQPGDVTGVAGLDAAARMDADCRALLRAPCIDDRLHALRRVAWSATLATAYVYLEPDGPVTEAMGSMVASTFAQRCQWVRGAREVRASRIEQVFDTPGASAGAKPVFHYAVEMDPDTGWMPEIARWYDTEHMPGLAAVPGCIRASRFINHGHGPLSLACYDLVTEDTLGSPPWLAVRATPWSDITRPHFTNTLRTMFRIPPAGA